LKAPIEPDTRASRARWDEMDDALYDDQSDRHPRAERLLEALTVFAVALAVAYFAGIL